MKVLTIAALLCSTLRSYGDIEHQLSERAVSSNESLIVKGTPSSIRQYPFMSFLLIMYTDGDVECGSTILTPFALLTAAVCFTRGSELMVIQISIASAFISRGVYHYTIEYVKHRQYIPSQLDYNIAVVKTVVEMTLNGKLTKAVKLVDEDHVVAAISEVDVLGWGRVNEGGNKTDYLRVATVPVVPLVKCQTHYGDKPKITHRMFCTGDLAHGGKDVCMGDTGGPAIDSDGYQVGVISWARCGKSNAPSVYTDIASMRNWIREVAHVS